MGPQKCKVCEDANSKYKCPTCLLPYCSLPCYKRHKENPCVKGEPLVESNGSSRTHKQPPRPFEVADEQGWRLEKGQFEALAASEELRHMLKNPELQELIKKIDSSTDVQKDLNTVLEVELFRDFRDKVFATLNPQ
ncbi:hypothetical protein GOP47_0018884 [Adiantum capillus-veneris]|uniref:Zinc finger HIT domain-containing protein 3 n=1 Tax=Adiantum capillus-veneris TaxID=13818 RepID=A0A9D4UE86_ADICA|nr:hypothetical protein GOP47_0018884 [Adiantum capillus-veneris]